MADVKIHGHWPLPPIYSRALIALTSEQARAMHRRTALLCVAAAMSSMHKVPATKCAMCDRICIDFVARTAASFSTTLSWVVCNRYASDLEKKEDSKHTHSANALASNRIARVAPILKCLCVCGLLRCNCANETSNLGYRGSKHTHGPAKTHQAKYSDSIADLRAKSTPLRCDDGICQRSVFIIAKNF